MSGLIKNLNARVAVLLIASAVGIFVGATGLLSRIVDFSGTTVISGMMAGVGLILATVGVFLAKSEDTSHPSQSWVSSSSSGFPLSWRP